MSESLVSAFVRNPRNSLFGASKTDKAECVCVHCSCPLGACGLQARGECAMVGGTFLARGCPYGRRTREEGFTMRARKFSSWIADRKKRYEGTPSLHYSTTKLAFIGDYVFLPYDHMPEPFKELEGWVTPFAIRLLDLRPRNWHGGEIQSYQREIVPLFARHLREECPEIWQAIIKLRPALDTEPDHVGRKALVKTLKPGIQWTTAGKYANEYPVEWKWDGLKLCTASPHAYNDTWGGIARSGVGQVCITATPSDKATVVVQDNAWVTDDTVFID